MGFDWASRSHRRSFKVSSRVIKEIPNTHPTTGGFMCTFQRTQGSDAIGTNDGQVKDASKSIYRDKIGNSSAITGKQKYL
jgi:hypothetical protein